MLIITLWGKSLNSLSAGILDLLALGTKIFYTQKAEGKLGSNSIYNIPETTPGKKEGTKGKY